jgi:hypothetical protein
VRNVALESSTVVSKINPQAERDFGGIFMNVSLENRDGYLDPKLEANKKTVLAFYEAGLNRKDFEAASKFIGERYVQHNPLIADDIEGFKAFLGFLKETFPGWPCTRMVCACPATEAQRSSTSSSLKTERSSNTGMLCNPSRRAPLARTGCFDRSGYGSPTSRTSFGGGPCLPLIG